MAKIITNITVPIFHNPITAMAQLFYTIVAATTTLSYPPIWDQPYHITLLPLSYHRNLPQLAALLLTVLSSPGRVRSGDNSWQLQC